MKEKNGTEKIQNSKSFTSGKCKVKTECYNSFATEVVIITDIMALCTSFATNFAAGSLRKFIALNSRMSLNNVLFKRLSFTANLLIVAVISQPEFTETLLNAKCCGTVECGDNYEAKIINVMLEVAFKRCPKQFFLGPLVWKSKWRVQKEKEKESLTSAWKLQSFYALGYCIAVFFYIGFLQPLNDLYYIPQHQKFIFHHNIWFMS